MEANDTTVKILIIDDDDGFHEIIKEYFKEILPDSIYYIDFMNDYDSSIPVEKYNIFIIDNRIFGIEKAADIANDLKQKNKGCKVFVVSGFANYNLLKRLIQIGVSGFIDKDNIDLYPLQEAVLNVSKELQTIKKIANKIANISTLTSSVPTRRTG